MLQLLFGLVALTAAPATCGWRPGEVVEATGEVQAGGLRGHMVRRVETGSGRLFETDDLGIIITRNGFDGHLAWSQDMSGGIHDLNSGFARRLAASMAWLDGLQGCAPSTAKRLGIRTEKRRRFVDWRATPKGGVPFELWYDARTGRLDRAFFQTAETRLIRHFSDWRDIGGGRWVAFRQRDEFPEDESETLRRITHASVRRVATSADFARPQPPNDVAMLHGARSTSVPFDDDHRTRIFMPVVLNGKGPFLFELDNGGHDILTKETADALGLAGAGSFNSSGAGNAVSKSGIARVAQVRIGDAVIKDQPFSIRDFGSSNDRSPNPPRAGILGLELFERFVVAIDPAAKSVTLTPLGSTAQPAGAAVPLVFTEDAPLIAGTYRGHGGDFMLDTGNAGATIIEDYWARPLGLTAALDRGVPRGDAKASLGTVGLGPFNLTGEVVTYYGPGERGSEYTRAVAGIYGEPLLSRFKSTYDYSRYAVWFEPLPGVGPVPFDRSGLSLAKSDGGVLKVSAVTPGSPAAEASIRANDLIRAIDGKPSVALSRADAAAMLRQEPGTRVSLTGSFDGIEGSKTLSLRELVRP